ncbi:MAG: stage sporulation protein [Bacillales bacterium]|nr:stage sporulation protein [Bacillales bacterium]
MRTILVNPISFVVAILAVVILLIPSLVVLPYRAGPVNKIDSIPVNTTEKVNSPKPIKGKVVEVAVYRAALAKTEKLPIDDYLVGVVAAEMPADFELEALKAQALTARTFIMKRMKGPQDTGLPGGAIVSDTVDHQVYKNKNELKKIWGSEYEWKLNKITAAVRATSGQIITYNDEPITASFFSTSNGYTENSEDYWANKFPYLRSVKNPWDEDSPKFLHQKLVLIKDFEKILGVSIKGKSIGVIKARTEGHRVKEVSIGSKVFTGREIREKLDLKSSDFTWVKKDEYIVITTKGYGHGVGMSQYGANGMAKKGKTYEEIIDFYYKDVKIKRM